MRISALAPALLVALSIVPERVSAQTNSDSSTTDQSSTAGDPKATQDSPDWLFPVAKLNEILPNWLRIGGEYRNRLEGPSGIGYAGTRDFYLLDRLRVHATIQPKPW